jgi:hypothetical protein
MEELMTRVYKVTVEIADTYALQYKVTIERHRDTIAEFEDHLLGSMNRIGPAIMQDVEESL